MLMLYDWNTGKSFDPWKKPKHTKVKFCPIDIITAKTEEALQRKHTVLSRFDYRKKNLAIIKDLISKTEYDLYIAIEEYKKTEIQYIDAWIAYWQGFLKKDKKDSELDIVTAREYSLVDLFDGKLTKSGHDFIGRCPFHGDKTASFHIYTKNNRFYCFGCNVSGDAIDYVTKVEKLTFIEAVRRLS